MPETGDRHPELRGMLAMLTDAICDPGAAGARVTLWRLMIAAGTVVSISTLLGFLGSLWWFFDLFAHFRVQYALGLLLVVGAMAASGRWGWAGAFAAAALLNLANIAPFYVGTSVAQAAAPGSRALVLNVQAENDRYEIVRAVIQQYDPDVLVLLEMTRAWSRELESLAETYPYAILQPQDDRYGLALYSRFPLEEGHILSLGGPDRPAIKAVLHVADRRLTVLALHPPPPVGADLSGIRNAQLSAIPDHVAPDGASLVLGDLNVTPWSWHFRHLLRASRLRNSLDGRGVQPTWPVNAPLFLIPIDHCLHSQDVVILDRSVGPAVGSDHYPLIVDFTLSPVR